MKNVSDLLTRLEVQSREELVLFEAQTQSALSAWRESLQRSLSRSLATIENDMERWGGGGRASQRRYRNNLNRSWGLMLAALATGLLLGGFVGMTEIARAIAPPPVPTTIINGRMYVLIDRTQTTFPAQDPKSLWVAAAR